MILLIPWLFGRKSGSYLVETTAEKLSVMPGRPEALAIGVVRLDAKGQRHPAPEVRLQASLPDDASGWAFRPASGQGRLDCTVSVERLDAALTTTLTVTATPPGKAPTPIVVTVGLTFASPFALEIALAPAGRLEAGADAAGKVVQARLRSQTDVGIDLAAASAEIAFALDGDPDGWLTLGEPGVEAGVRTLPVQARQPRPGAVPAEAAPVLRATVTVAGVVVDGALPLAIAAPVTLHLRSNLSQRVEVRYDRAARAWDFPRLEAFLSAVGAEEQLTAAPFPFLPDFKDEHGVLSFAAVRTFDGVHFAGPVALARGVDLDARPGWRWLHDSGELVVTARVRTPEGQVLEAQMSFVLRAQAEVVVFHASPPARAHLGARLGPNELCPDTRDGAYLCAFLHRIDQDLGVADVRAWRAMPLGAVAEPTSEGPEDEGLVAERQPQPGPAHHVFLVRSRRVLLASAARKDARLRVHLTGDLAGAAPAFLPEVLPADIDLAPRPLHVKLVVVPGERPGRAQAGAVAHVWPGVRDAVAGVPLTLRVTAAADPGPALTLESPAEVVTDAEGLATWELGYAGLTWETLRQARFHVTAGPTGADGRPGELAVLDIDAPGRGPPIGAASLRSADSIGLVAAEPVRLAVRPRGGPPRPRPRPRERRLPQHRQARRPLARRPRRRPPRSACASPARRSTSAPTCATASSSGRCSAATAPTSTRA